LRNATNEENILEQQFEYSVNLYFGIVMQRSTSPRVVVAVSWKVTVTVPVAGGVVLPEPVPKEPVWIARASRAAIVAVKEPPETVNL